MANYATDFKQYIDNIITDILPISDLKYMNVTKSGLVPLTKSQIIEMTTQLPDTAKIYEHEKCTTTRYGILAGTSTPQSRIFHSHYIRPFDGYNIFDKLLVQGALELYPTPVSTYGVTLDPYGMPINGGAVIDLNHLKMKDEDTKIKGIRLDVILHAYGLEKDINSFADFQTFINNESVKKMFTPRAIVQVGLSSYFIPNAIGETDSNSRNIILLYNPMKGKFEYVVRIDAESNTYLNDIYNERSGQKRIPKGIFSASESFDTEFLKHISQKDTSIDWDLFAKFLFLTQDLTTRTRIDNATNKAYSNNYGKVDEPNPNSIAYSKFGLQATEDFSEKTIDRVKRYNEKIFNVLIGHRKDYPFVSEIPIEKSTKLKMADFDEHGREL